MTVQTNLDYVDLFNLLQQLGVTDDALRHEIAAYISSSADQHKGFVDLLAEAGIRVTITFEVTRDSNETAE